MDDFYRPPHCARCGAPATRVAYDAPTDRKSGLCEACAAAGGYRACALCGFDYAPEDMREEEGQPTCVYCVGERDYPFFEEE
ncbi:MAG: hypothetical protein HQK87_08720 [Nitrospinae bacterium]|nr:hypothetical protein [Nitrospinota bacterium]